MIALSWSRVSDWLQCHRKFYWKYVAPKGERFVQEDATKSVHLVKGAELHKQLETYVYDKLNGKDTSKTPYSAACRDTLPMIDKILNSFRQVWPERQVAINSEWRQVEWFAPDVAWRAIWDFSGINDKIALLIDWKSGKIQDYDADEPGQLHLSAAMAMDIYNVEEVVIFYAFIEHKVKKPDGGMKLTKANDYQPIRQYFTKIYEDVNAEKNWKPTANPYCSYCPATKAQCPFSRKSA